MLKSHSHTLTLSRSHSLTLSHSFTLSFTHSQHAEQLLFSCLCSKITLSLSHSHTLALSHFHTLSMSHSITLDMLNKFGFHVYAHKSLFIAENCNVFFYISSSPWVCQSYSWFPANKLKVLPGSVDNARDFVTSGCVNAAVLTVRTVSDEHLQTVRV